MKFILNGTKILLRLKELNIDTDIRRIERNAYDVKGTQLVHILEMDSLEKLMKIAGLNDLKIRKLDMFEYPLIEVA